jgi:hypothetical protein
VELAERFADGLATADDMQQADINTIRSPMCPGFGAARWTLWGPWRGHDGLFKSVRVALELVREANGLTEAALQCVLVRDLLGSPSRPGAAGPTVLTPPVVTIARAAYDERILPEGHLGTARLAILSDALEEAGCTELAILSHLRSAGPHVRGCWALDLILGKA